MSLLLHTCCGPCASYTTLQLMEKGFKPVLFFYNPNIHPYQEYLKRLEGAEQLASARQLQLLTEKGYDLEEFLANVAADPRNRCGYCYRIRLSKTAAKAKELGYNLFSSTLLISPYQNRDLLCKIGHEIAAEYGLRFHDEDFRPGFRQSQQIAKDLGLYRQKYCGCIYSEKERFCKGSL